MIENAVILAGGFGTRLQPLTFDIPKPLLPVGNRPFLETQFFRLKQAGVKRVVLSVFHQAPQMRAALKTMNRFGLKVSVALEPKPLGTGGAIAFAWPDRSKPCLVLNGDVLSDFAISPLVRRHEQSGAKATLWVIEVQDTSAFGVIESSGGGRIKRFIEKPKKGQTRSHSINAGLYALSPEVLGLIPRGKMVSIEREIFPRLLSEKMSAFAFKAARRPYWNDIGNPAAYLRANLDLLDGRMKLGALFKGLKGDSVIGKGCTIGKGAEISRSVLLPGCRVGEGARIEGAVLGRHCEIGKGASIRPGAVLGASTILPEGSRA